MKEIAGSARVGAVGLLTLREAFPPSDVIPAVATGLGTFAGIRFTVDPDLDPDELVLLSVDGRVMLRQHLPSRSASAGPLTREAT